MPVTSRADPPTVVVVGLGPGPAEHVTLGARAAIERVATRFVRTTDHPQAGLLAGAVDLGAIDLGAGRGVADPSGIVTALVDAARRDGEVLYAVPGSPLVLEPTVTALRRDRRVRCTVLPALSFVELAWDRLDLDPVAAGVRLVQGADVAAVPPGAGPLLVAGIGDPAGRDAVVRALSAAGDASQPVVVLRRLGHRDESVRATTVGDLADLADRAELADRADRAEGSDDLLDDLTCLFVPAPAGPRAALAAGARFHDLVRVLLERCPWDRRQTHASLVPHLIEESFELVDALQALDPADAATRAAVVEELGDVLYHVEFHAAIAERAGHFTMADVVTGIHDKLVRRHPHVFGDVTVDGADAVVSNWDEIKRTEKGRTSAFDGVPTSSPALAYAQQLMAKAAKVGFDWPDVTGPLAKVDEELAELRAAMAGGDPAEIADELGDVIVATVNVARHLGVDAELAGRAAAGKFRQRFGAVEALAVERGIDIRTAGLAVLDALWDDVKS